MCFQAFLFIPNNCIISVTRVRNDPLTGPIVNSHEDLFKQHADADQLCLALFLMVESLKGQSSFWHPYIDVMNTSDLAYLWNDEELKLLNDYELMHQAHVYRQDIEDEWD
jgi:hypothetical protein